MVFAPPHPMASRAGDDFGVPPTAALRGARLMGLCGLGLVPLYAALDRAVGAEPVALFLAWRVATLGLVAAALAALSTRRGRRRPLRLGVAVTVAIGLQLDVAAGGGARGLDPYHPVVIVVLLLGSLLLPWSPARAALTAGILIAGFGLGTLAFAPAPTWSELGAESLLLALTATAVVAAAAVRERARRGEHERRSAADAHASRQEALAKLSQAALSAHDPGALLDHAVSLAARALAVPCCAAFELRPGERVLRLRAGVGWPSGSAGRMTVDATGDSVFGRALKGHEPVIVRDHRDDRRRAGAPLHGVKVVGTVCVPIAGDDRPFGVFSVHTFAPRVFSEADVEFLRTVAHVLGTAIARHHADTVQGEEAESSAALARAGRELLAVLGTSELLARLSVLSVELLRADQSSSWLVRWDEQALVPASRHGIDDARWAEAPPFLPLAALGGLLGRLERDLVVRLTARGSEDGIGRLLDALGIEVASVVLLRRGDEGIGVQVNGWKGALAAPEPSPRIVHGLMQLAALALANAHVVERIERAQGVTVRPAAAAAAGDGTDPPDAAARLARTERNTMQALAAAGGALGRARRRRKRLLFADDLAMTRIVMRRFLERVMPHVEILEAPDGAEAVAIAEVERPDVVLLDLRMTNMDGWEAARRIRALPGNERLPILATSVTTGREVEERVRRVGFTEFIPKPVSDYRLLRQRLEHYLRDAGDAAAPAPVPPGPPGDTPTR